MWSLKKIKKNSIQMKIFQLLGKAKFISFVTLTQKHNIINLK